MRLTLPRFSACLIALLLLPPCGYVLAQPAETDNQIPNPEFRGSLGVVDDLGGTEGTISGTIPTLWRAFVRGGGDIGVDVSPLLPDELFAGSPSVNAASVTINDFGADDVGFDTSPTRFTVDPARTYRVQVYMRSNNSDNSDQDVGIAVPVFDDQGAFTGRAPGSFNTTVTDTWTLYEGPDFQEAAGTAMELSFRLAPGVSDNAIQIALPSIVGVPLTNQALNPGFAGAGGATVGAVSGNAPDGWRVFAVGGGDATVSTEPLAADELYPNSPAGQLVRLTVNSLGADQGFDNEIGLMPILPGRHYQGQVYLRSGNQDTSDVPVGIGLNVFDELFNVVNTGVYSGVAGSQWNLYSTFSVRSDPSAFVASLAIRPTAAGDTLLIALPRVPGPQDTFFQSSFEAPPAP